MNLSWIDWAIVFAAILFVRWVSWSAGSLMRGVADFLSANRTAGRYLLTISGEMANFGVISLVAGWQAFTTAGFPTIWWGMMSSPLPIVLALTGWVFYRLRETRSLTVGQFFEVRYSRKFRIFAGLLCWLSGILNFGIFPAIAARFLIYFCGLPDTFSMLGLHIATYPALMVADLGLALFFVNSGGQISIMITECAQGIIAAAAYLAIAVAVLLMVPWEHTVAALQTAPVNASMLNPFHTSQVKDFNVWYYLISIVVMVYGSQTWLGAQGFMTSARNPHEQRMGSLITVWRQAPLTLMTLVLPLAAFTILHDSHYAAQAANVNDILHHIGNKAIQNEMVVPVTLAHLLPVGIKGLLVMVVVFLSFTCHDTYMHSWGSIFVQDVVMPLRNKPMPPEEHVRWLRWSIFFVAVFAFCFSLVYVETDKIYFFQIITGTIWIGGAGSVMIGGLYTRFGTTAGAFAALIVGAVFGVGGLILPVMWQTHHTTPFPINGQWQGLISIVLAFALYVIVSLATGGGRRPFNLERMLHRGPYTVDPHEHETKSVVLSRWQELLGMGKEFSKGDRRLAIAYAAWTLGWWLVFVAVSAMHFVWNAIPETFWPKFWHTYLLILVAQSVPAIVWFTIGGLKDTRDVLKLLKTVSRDPLDDGRVRSDEPTVGLASSMLDPEMLREPQSIAAAGAARSE
ncbi:MAG: sodium:solute symporter [Capsulimonas sp.]|uniref:sodium:solute symporter family protein n=1 Tax=Capsulimonas sp. TaxID=2494211 RepID=UPI003263FDDE